MYIILRYGSHLLDYYHNDLYYRTWSSPTEVESLKINFNIEGTVFSELKNIFREI